MSGADGGHRSATEQGRAPKQAAAASQGAAARQGDGTDAQRSGAQDAKPWLHGEDMRVAERRWKAIQVSFVEDPRRAVVDANTLVADLMQRLAWVLFDERAELEERLLTGDGLQVEDLRKGLHEYRSVYRRLLISRW